jgi:hypothetical protein
MAVEPGSAAGGVPSLGYYAEFFAERVRPRFRIAQSDRMQALVKLRSIAESPTTPANLVRTMPALAGSVDPPQRTPPALMLALSFGDLRGFRDA